MRKSTCPFCGVEQQIQDKQLADLHTYGIHIKCYQCGEVSSYSKSVQPADLDLKKLFIFEKKEVKIPLSSQVQFITQYGARYAGWKQSLTALVFAILFASNIFFVVKLNLHTNIQPEVQKLHLTSAAVLPTVPEKEIELKIVNQFEATVLVPKATIRLGPGLEHPAIYSLKQREKILVKGWSKNWMNVELSKENQKITGWVRADLITGSLQ